MFFHKKKSVLHIKLLSQNQCLYDGPLLDLPLPEPLIVEKSIQFYDDSEPCHIHKGAVRSRLLFEIEEELSTFIPCVERQESSCELSLCPRLISYTDFPSISQILCYKR